MGGWRYVPRIGKCDGLDDNLDDKDLHARTTDMVVCVVDERYEGLDARMHVHALRDGGEVAGRSCVSVCECDNDNSCAHTLPVYLPASP